MIKTKEPFELFVRKVPINVLIALDSNKPADLTASAIFRKQEGTYSHIYQLLQILAIKGLVTRTRLPKRMKVLGKYKQNKINQREVYYILTPIGRKLSRIFRSAKRLTEGEMNG